MWLAVPVAVAAYICAKWEGSSLITAASMVIWTIICLGLLGALSWLSALLIVRLAFP